MESAEIQARKQALRGEARARRRRQPAADSLSRTIFEWVMAASEYRSARTLMSYVSFRSEVSTREFIASAWRDGKQVVVPFCAAERLELFRLQSFDELAAGTLGILEPQPALRELAERRAEVEELDLIIVPGLAFDASCGRIGYGKGFYDRLLAQAPAKTAIVGVAFQCQIFAEVPLLPYDIRADKVITEQAIYTRSQPRWDGHSIG
jgi:5-formyltetrahydrofolate cyclo-ligase